MHNKSRLKHYHSKPIFEELEARQLFSAGVEALLTEQIPVPEASYSDASAPVPAAESQPQPVVTLDSKTEPYQIVFVDTRVEGYQKLIDDITNNAAEGSNIEVVQLNDSKDGISQITEILAARENLDAIHIISHGSDGSLDLGNSQLNFDTLIQNQTDISAWGNAFKENGDILLYGCNVAETQFGQSFVDYLAGITNTDIAASVDATGNTASGGDWELEYQSGVIEAEEVLNSEAQTQWNDVLAVTANSTSSTQTTDLGLTGNKLTWSHTVNDGVNRALFVETVVSTTGTQVQSVTFGGVALTKIGSSSTNHPIEIWVLVNPTVSTANIVVTYNASGAAAAGATTYNGVNQSSAFSGFTKANGTGTTATVDVSSATGDLVMDAQYWANSSANLVGTSQTSQWSQTITGTMKTGSTTEVGASTVTMTGTSTVSSNWEIAAVNIKAAANTAPVLSSSTGTLSYPENAGPYLIGSTATITDTDSTDFDGGQLTIQITANSLAEDRLTIRNQGTSAGQVGVSGTSITYGGVIVGSFNGPATGGTALVVTFNANSTASIAQAVLHNLTYENTSKDPSTTTRTITAKISDGDGGTSNTVTSYIAPTKVNDAPINTVPAAQTTNEDTVKVFSTANGNAITIADVDAGGANNEITLTVTNGTLTLSGTTGLTFVAGDGTADATMTIRGSASAINTALNGLSYTPTANYNGSATLTVSTLDATLLSLNIDTSLQARYSFDGNANDVASGTAQNGSLAGNATFTADATRGQVLNLDGVDDYVDLTSQISSFSGLSQGSISAWVKLTANGERTIFDIGDGAANANFVSLYALDGKLTAVVAINGIDQLRVSSNSTINDGNWHHVTFTVNSAGNALYIDGNLSASTYTTGSSATTKFIADLASKTHMQVGAFNDGTIGGDFQGNIDDLRIYSRAITASEVQTLASDLSLTATDTVAVTVAAVNDAPNDLYAISGVAESSLIGVYGFTNPTNLGRDAAGNNVPMTLYGNPGQTTGPSGSGALDLAGGTSGQYGDIVGITTGGAMTFAASVKFDSTGDWQRVFDFGQSTSGGIGNVYVGREWNTNNLTFTIEKNGVYTYRATANSVITNGSWLHFAATVDATGNMNLYVNGNLAASTTGVALETGVRSNNFIGKSHWGGDAAFDGAIDNFIVANGVMSANQVAALYQQTSGFTVAENAANGTVVGTLVGFDVDASANPTYSLTDSAGGRFAIGSDGTLTVANGSLLDFETTSSHIITVRVSDAAGATYDENFTIQLLNVNEAPAISAIESTALAYTENGAATAVTSTLVISDVDSANLSGATVQITGNYVAGQDVLAFTNQNGITGSWNASTGVLTLTGSASVANYQTALRSVTYVNLSNTPNTATRTISLVVTDGSLNSNTATRTISVSAVNDAPTFLASNGYTTTSIASGMPQSQASAVQTDGKIVIVGWASNGSNDDFAVARYNADGSLDSSFGNSGTLLLSVLSSTARASAVVVQPDGKIVVGGSTFNGSSNDFTLVRLNANGTLDTSFGTSGKAILNLGSADEVTDIALQADGKIVVGGYTTGFNFMLARYTSNGVLDSSFGAGAGYVITDFAGFNDRANDVLIQADGKIILAGEVFDGSRFGFGVVRYNADGGLDNTFGVNGKQIVLVGSTGDAAATFSLQQADGKILLGGYANPNGTQDFALARLNVNGTLDNGFGSNGTVVTPIGTGSDLALDGALQADGKIVVTGKASVSFSDDFATVRYNTNGSLDTSFGGTGIKTQHFGYGDDRAYGVHVLNDQSIVVTGHAAIVASGSTGFALMKYDSEGNPDCSFAASNSLGGTVNFTENGGFMVLDSDVTVFDAELSSSNFAGATLTLSRDGGASSQDTFSSSQMVMTQGSNLTYAGTTIGTVTQNSAGTLLLTFNANATASLVNAALRTITYRNTSDAPPASVQLNWTLNDANTGAQGTGGALTGSGTTTVNITSVNDAPVISAVEATTVAYTENAAATAITATLSLADLDNTNLTGATVQITDNYASGQDVLAFSDQNGITGSWDSNSGTLTLSGTATVAQYQAALRSVTYQNTSDAPSTASRTVSFSVTEGTATSNLATRSLSVAAVNDAPVNSLPANSYTAVNTSKIFSNGNALQIADVDVDASSSNVQVTLSINHGSLMLASTTSLTLVSGANGSGSMTYSGTVSAINAALNNGLTFTPDSNYRGLAQLTMTTSDQGNTGSGGTLTDTDTLDVHVGAIVVTNTTDVVNGNTSSIDALIASSGGDGISLREAIAAANNTAGTDYIYFSISGTSVHTINLTSPLTITSAVVLDATSDDSFSANGSRPAIVLNGGGTTQYGIQLYGGSDGSTIRGLVIQNFTGNGIDISGSNGNTIAGNWIGLNAAGTGAASNQYGINIWNSSNNFIGGSAPADRNVISGNTRDGIVIATDNASSTGNLIQGNYIGTNADGSAAVGNGGQGLWINAAGNTIGGTVTGQGNVISGTTGWAGITLSTQASGTLIAGNLIGTNAAGTAALGNTGPGIAIESANNIIGGTMAAARNIISGNLNRGILLTGAGATGNVVIGNYIGTDITGTQDLNGSTPDSACSGVVIQEGATNNRIGTNADGVDDAAERNVISGNNWFGVEFLGTGTSGNVVQGNYIGTDATGLVALGNAQGGVSFWNGASNNRLGGGAAGAGNVISGNGTGVQLGNGVSDNRVQGNVIGLGADGSTVAGNTGVGILVFGGGTTAAVNNNIIGTDTDGTNDASEGNVISGNFRGIALANQEVSGTRISGNLIGTDATGTLNRGNTSDGIYILSGANGTLVGGVQAGQANVIAFNGRDGIRVEDTNSTGNVFLGNAIHTNTALGINLVGGSEDAFGVTANDAGDVDSGPNSLLNTMVLTRAVVNGTNLTFSGTYNGAANSYYRIEVFSDSTASGEGRIYLNALNMAVGSSGTVNIQFNFSDARLATGQYITVTATLTDSSYSTFYETSEFSNAVVTETPDSAPVGQDHSITITEDTSYTFTTADFPLTDIDSNNLSQVWIESLPGSGTLYLNGVAVQALDAISAADIQSGKLTYTPAADATALTSFLFSIVDDGSNYGGGQTLDSTANTLTINITAVNDAPVFSNLNGSPTFIENGSAVVLDADVSLFDAELSGVDNFSGATLTLARHGGVNAEDALAFDGITVTVSGTDVYVSGVQVGTYTFTGGQMAITFGENATQARVNSLMRNTVYWNWSENPPASVQIDWTFNDANASAQGSGGALTSTGSTTVNITAVNNAPMLFAIESTTLAYSENATATAITATLALSDADNANLTGATVKISGNYASGQDVLAFADQNGITGSWDSNTGTLTLSGSATVAQYQTALRSVAYQNTSDAPSTASRTVSFSVNDGTATSNVGTRSISVTAVNDAPTAVADHAIAIEAGGVSNGTAGINPTGNVLNNDTDPDAGDTKTVIGVAAGSVSNASTNVGASIAGSYGSITIAADGSYAYIVDNNNATVQALRTTSNTLTDMFTYTMLDTAGLTSTKQITVTVQGANDAPTDLVAASYLSTLTPTASSNNYSGVLNDVSHTTNPLILDDVSFARGLGMHAPPWGESTVDYAINGATSFKATIGVNGASGSVTYGSVVFRVYVDNVLRYTSNVLTSTSDPIDIAVDTTGASTLRLSVDNAGINGNNSDHAVWFNARLEGGTVGLSVAENSATGSVVGSLNRIDADWGDNATYALINDAGGRFAINASTGQITVANGSLLNFEAAASHDIIVRGTDAGGLSVDKTFTISLTDVNEAPVISSASLTLSEGQTVTLSPANFGVTDQDNTSFTYTVSSVSGGYFQLTTATGVSITSFSSAQLAANQVQFVDDGNEVAPSFSVTVSDGELSSNTLAATISYSPVNDAPVLNPYSFVYSITEDSAPVVVTVATVLGSSDSDADVTDPLGMAITSISGSGGSIAYSIDGGTTWLNVGAVSDTSALLLRSTDMLRFTPNGQNGGTMMTAHRAWDQTSGVFGTKVDTSVNGGTTAFSTATNSVTIAISSVNDAPVLDNSGTMTLTTITEDQSNNSGNTVASIIASAGGDRVTDVDSGAGEGIAITGTGVGYGKWQYSLDGGANWLDVGTVSDTSALLLRATDSIRFLPQYENGSTPTFTFRAWDQSAGTAGSTADASSNGGITAFSSVTETASIIVTDVNDAPVLFATQTPVLQAVNEDAGAPVGAVGTLVSALVDFQLPAGQVDNVSDEDIGAVLGIAIVGADASDGTWYYTTNGGTSWSALGTVNDANALLLAADADSRVYFAPNANFNGSVNTALTFRAWDQSTGTAGSTADASNNGGTTAFSSTSDIAAITVNAVNDAPVLNAVNLTVNEGQIVNLTAADFNVTDVDNSSFSVTLSDVAGGFFQLSTNNGVAISSFTSSQLGNGLVQFVDDGNEVAPSFSATVNDGTVNSNTLAATINYSPVNEAPTDIVVTRYLSDQAFITNSVYDLTINKGHSGDPIVLDGVVYARGLGTHTGPTGSYDYVDYAIDGASSFKATIGINDYQSDTYGSVKFLVYLDGVLAYSSPVLDSSSKPIDLNIDTGNATTLRLAVDRADNGNLFDHAVWANARLEGGTVTLASVPEGAATGTLIGNVVGIDVDNPESWSYALIDNAGGRFAISAATGMVSVADGSLLNYEAATTHDITVRATDSGGLSVDKVFTISLVNVNEAPVLTSASLTLDEGETVTLSAANFGVTDPDNNNFTYTISSVSGGYFRLSTVTGTAINGFTSADLTSGLVQFVDDGNEVAPSFSVTVNDGLVDSNTVAATINYTPVNDASTVANPIADQNTSEDSAFSFQVPANTFADVDVGDALSYTATLADGSALPNWLTFNAATQTFSGTPANADVGSISIRVTATDGNGGMVYDDFALTVANVNDAPVLNLTDNAFTFVENASHVRVGSSATLADADSSDFAGGTLTATISGNGTAEDRLFLVTQGSGPGQVQVVGTDVFIDGNLVATTAGGVGAGDPLVVAFTVNANASAVEAVINRVSFRNVSENPSDLQRTVEMVVADGDGGTSNTDSVLINVTPVNDAPVMTGASLTLNEGQTITLSAANFSITDPDNSSFTFTVSSVTGGYFQLTTNPSVSVTSFSSTDLTGGLVQFVDDGNEVAPSFSVTVNDGTLDSNTLAATINYTAVNDAPVAISDSFSGNEDTVITGNVLGNDSDIENDTFTAILESAPANGSLTLNADGTFSYTPNANWNGTDSFTYKVNDGSLDSNIVTVTLTVYAVNDAPTTAPTTMTPIAEDSGPRLITQAELLANASDVDGPSLTATGLSIGSESGTLVDNGNGTWTYTPAANDNTAVSFSYTVTDGSLSAAGSATLDITSVNDAPHVTWAGNYSFTTDENSPSSGISVNTLIVNGPIGSVGYSDVDAGSVKGMAVIAKTGSGTWQYSTDGSSWVDFGAVSDTHALLLDGGTLVRYVPDGINTEIAQLQIRGWDQTTEMASTNSIASYGDASVNDYDHAYSYEIATVTCTVSDVNDPPSGTDMTITINEDAAYTFNAADFGFSDVDGNALLAVKISTLPSVGSLTLNGVAVTTGQTVSAANINSGLLKFTPTANANGTGFAGFTFQVQDDGGTANGGIDIDPSANTITVNVEAVNDAPVLNSATLNVNEGGTVALSTANFSISDPDNSSFTYTVSNVSGGYFQLTTATGMSISSFTSADLTAGLVQFVDDGNEVAPSFSVTVNDGPLDSNTLAATISYTAVNDNAPLISSGSSASVDENSPVATVVYTASGSDADGNSLSWSLSGADAALLSIDANTGVVTLNAPANYENKASYSFNVVVSDGTFSSSQAVTLTVNNLNDNPVSTVSDSDTTANSVNENAANGTVVGLTALATDADSGATISYSMTDTAGGRFAIDSSTGVVTVADGSLLNYEAATSHSITVLASSDDGSFNSQSFTINVSNVNDNAPVLNDIRLTMTEGQTITLDSANFDIADLDSNPLIYTVSNVSGGYFQLVTAPGVSITGFNDADLVNGQVQFVHNGSDTMPGFNLCVNDGFADSNTLAATFNYTAIDNPVISVMPDFSQNPVTNSSGIHELIQQENSLSQAETDSIQQSDNTTTGDADVIVDLNAYIDKLITENRMAYEALADGTGFYQASANNAGNQGGFADIDKNIAYEDKEYVKRRFLTASSSLSTIEFQTIDTDNTLTETEEKEFWNNLERISKHMDSPDVIEEAKPVDIKVVLGASVSLTAGFVSWILRAGSLMASFMSTVPLLRRFDPLPILRTAKKYDEPEVKALADEDSESEKNDY